MISAKIHLQKALSLRRERNELTFGGKLSGNRLGTEELTTLNLLQWFVSQLELLSYIHRDNSELYMTHGIEKLSDVEKHESSVQNITCIRNE